MESGQKTIFALQQNFMADEKNHLFDDGRKQKLPTGKQVLKNIYLSFFTAPKWRIGVNGSGKIFAVADYSRH